SGTWDIVSLCVEGDLVAVLNAESTADQPACAKLFTSAKLAGTGAVTYAAGAASYSGTFEQTVVATYTPECFSALSSGMALNASTCSQTQTGLNQTAGTNATCTYSDANCLCGFTVPKDMTQSVTYTVSGTTISESNGDSYTICVNGNTMNQRQLIGGDVYGVTQMRKR
ncbi:MAG TPA: hypothetical protein VF518_05115, partial [Polyangia bacterium]